MHVEVVDHPVVTSRLSRLRSGATDRPAFRQILRQLGADLVYEAARQFPTRDIAIETPMGAATGAELASTPVLVPILRAALGMLAGALDVLPYARTGFLGLQRDEETLTPVAYMNTLPDLAGADVLLLDPMLATAGSANYACDQLSAAGAGSVTLVCVLAAPEGIDCLRANGGADRVVTAAIDAHLNEVGFIVPGLGDAGDRQFGVF